jgi:endonuclease/exonuclease/phosphatase family metal-dependent hydrolase
LSQGANDVGRDILAVRAEPAPGCFVGLFAVHIKSGFEDIDLFRRQVEVERIVQAVAAYRQTRPADGLVILGDFNEQVDDPDLGTVIGSEPAGLPSSYQTGGDIQFPLVYQPFMRLAEVGFMRVEATWEDLDLTVTWNEAERLDYVMFGQAVLEGSEVYNSCEDNGVDDDPPGNYLEKAGEPLPCFISGQASDHLPVVADLVL